MHQLILGGARSGKSNLAQEIALQHPSTVTVIATAEAKDKEMEERIAHHQAERPDGWKTVESSITLADTLKALDSEINDGLILVDCLTLWVTNLLLAEEDLLQKEFQSLLQTLPTLNSEIIFVSNETGQGIIPLDSLSRRFVDEAGRLHQQVARLCDRVIYCVAGLPQVLKGPPLSGL